MSAMPRRALMATLIGALAITAAVIPHASCEGARPVVGILPLGAVEKDAVSRIAAGIGELYDVGIVILPAEGLPKGAYYPARGRYRADRLLDFLEGVPCRGCTKIMGVAAVDISCTKGSVPDWGVFGLGSMGGKACVISSFRLRRGVTREAFLSRLVKVANHELGHTFGLPHCPVRGCLMEDAKGTVVTVDNESGSLCASCRRRLGNILTAAPPGARRTSGGTARVAPH